MADIFCKIAEQISIHAPHEGERLRKGFRAFIPFCISIHAPHEGERLSIKRRKIQHNGFQSTLPTRGSDFHCCLILID